jgi:long-chain fatty acid transport protein
VVLCALLGAAGAARADAQTVFEQFNFEFSFTTPGARANGMGRTATALPDDATAAESNPAGLTRWTKPLLAFEAKSSAFTTYRYAQADAFSTLQPQVFGERVSSPSFFSGVGHAAGFTFALYGQQYLRYEEHFSLERRRIPDTLHYFLPVQGSLNLTGSNWGGAVARKLGSRLAAGVTCKLSVLSVDTTTERGNVFDVRLDSARLTNVQAIDDRDTAFGLGAGLLWHAFLGSPLGALGPVDVGVSYSWNPAFTVEERFSTVTETGALVPVRGYPRPMTISIPDRLAAGLAAHLFRMRLVLATDVVWMRYSELGGNHSSIIPDIGEYKRDEFQADDQVEVHLGAELRIGSRLRVRGGAYSIPAHRLRYTGETETDAGRGLDLTFNLGRRGTRWAGTGGLGYEIVRGHMDVNAAYGAAPSADDFVMSAAWSF